MERPLIKPNLVVPLINGTSMASSITSVPTSINRLAGISYDVAWTGSPVGTFSVQISNTYSQSATGAVIAAGNWNTILSTYFTNITYPVPSGSAGHGFIDLVETQAAWARIVYNFTSGTGNLTVVVAAKVF